MKTSKDNAPALALALGLALAVACGQVDKKPRQDGSVAMDAMSDFSALTDAAEFRQCQALLSDDQKRQTLRFERPPGAKPPLQVVLVRERLSDEPDYTVTWHYAARSLGVFRNGSCKYVDEESSLTYQVTHHNFDDSVTAVVDGVRYVLAWETLAKTTGEFSVTLSGVVESTNRAAFPPVDLRITGAPAGAGPGTLPFKIKALMADNKTNWQDESGAYPPWVEIVNTWPDADLGGYALSDDPAQPMKWRVPKSTVVKRDGVLRIAVDGQPEEGGLHASFRLRKDGGILRLTAPDGTSRGERRYGPQETDAIQTWPPAP